MRGRELALRLLQCAGRQSEIDRAADFVAQQRRLIMVGVAVALHVIEGPAHDDREFVDEGRLETGETILREANERRRDRLMRAALRRKRNPGWRPHDDKPRGLVTGIVQRIETSLDERVI